MINLANGVTFVCINLINIMNTRTAEASQNATAGLSLIIQGKSFTWHHQYINGAQVKNLAGIPPDKILYMGLVDPFDDEVIENDQEVNLARPGIEKFYIREPLELQFEKTKFSWDGPFIKENELRALLGIAEGDEIWLKIADPYDDELITGTKKVDLTRPGVEHIYVKKRIVSIRINYKEYQIARGNHAVNELKELAGVKLSHELDQLIEHQLLPLDDSATITIVGGEQFFAHVRDGSSS